MNRWIEPLVLEGRTVRLEPLTLDHAAGLLRAADPDLFRVSPQGPDGWSEAGFRAEISRVLAIHDTVAFAVIHPADGPIGRTTYMEIREADRGVEIGRTWIARRHQGSAVNPEMKYLMLRHAFEGLIERGRPSAIRVQFKTDLRNTHSQRAIEKLGAVREGELRKHMLLPDGHQRTSVVYSITDEEWPQVKRKLEERLASA